ncbi:DUF3099 domain-containing protein [Streptomyces sp. NPDC052051]|uniref:DUF3099 domain-containing protein n=1 Tax=Streptomyces sp. NPDC052051 TaxID=3154649 RepID=UPI00343FD673
MRKLNHSGGAPVFRITGARQGLAADVRGRQRRYVISMGVRTIAVILAATLWNVERPVAIVALVLGTFLPYIAVVIANAGRENAPNLPSTFVTTPVHPMIAPTHEEDSGARSGASEDRGRAGDTESAPEDDRQDAPAEAAPGSRSEPRERT